MMSFFVKKLFSTLQTGQLIHTLGLFPLLPWASVNWKFFKHSTQTECEHSLDHIGNRDFADDFSAGLVQKGCLQTGQWQAFSAATLSMLESTFVTWLSFVSSVLMNYLQQRKHTGNQNNKPEKIGHLRKTKRNQKNRGHGNTQDTSVKH